MKLKTLLSLIKWDELVEIYDYETGRTLIDCSTCDRVRSFAEYDHFIYEVLNQIVISIKTTETGTILIAVCEE